jgi:hypothetical protein
MSQAKTPTQQASQAWSGRIVIYRDQLIKFFNKAGLKKAPFQGLFKVMD